MTHILIGLVSILTSWNVLSFLVIRSVLREHDYRIAWLSRHDDPY